MIFLSQLNAKGRQIKQPTRIVPIVQAAMMVMVTYALHASQRYGKIWRYRHRIDILVQLRLKTQVNCRGMMSCDSLVIGAVPYWSMTS